MNEVIKVYRTNEESLYNSILCSIGALIWAYLGYFFINTENKVLISFLPLVFYVVAFILFFGIASLLFRANAMGNMILISEDQFPELNKIVIEGSKKLGLQSPPEAFLYNSNGLFNAFARQAFGRSYLLLTSSLVDASSDEQVKFVIGHELGHHASGHLNFIGFWLRFPARIIPFLHKAYLRQCEFTCDKIGYYLSRDLNHSCSAIQMLGCGCQKLNSKMNLIAFEKQENFVPLASGFVAEIFRSHPRLTRRVLALKNVQLFN
jgi:Zn-dependent protease with chaperone function